MSTIFFFFLSLLDRIKWNQGGDSSSRLHFVLRFSDTLPSLRLERLFLIYARALNILLLGLFSRFRNYLERIFFFFYLKTTPLKYQSAKCLLQSIREEKKKETFLEIISEAVDGFLLRFFGGDILEDIKMKKFD